MILRRSSEPDDFKAAAIRHLRKAATQSKEWSEWWAILLNQANGNVRSVLKLFDLAGVSTADISVAWAMVKSMSDNDLA